MACTSRSIYLSISLYVFLQSGASRVGEHLYLPLCQVSVSSSDPDRVLLSPSFILYTDVNTVTNLVAFFTMQRQLLLLYYYYRCYCYYEYFFTIIFPLFFVFSSSLFLPLYHCLPSPCFSSYFFTPPPIRFQLFIVFLPSPSLLGFPSLSFFEYKMQGHELREVKQEKILLSLSVTLKMNDQYNNK